VTTLHLLGSRCAPNIRAIVITNDAKSTPLAIILAVGFAKGHQLNKKLGTW